VLLKFKEVAITELNGTIKRDDLILEAKFRLSPSKRLFSRIKGDFYFDGQHIKSFFLGIPYYLAHQEEFPLRSVFSFEDINVGAHTVKLEMSGLWPSAGASDAKEITMEYKPLVKAVKIRAMPKIKLIEGPDIAILTDEAKKLYQEMKQRWKRELIAQRER